MPNMNDKSTVKAIAREYCDNGRNKTEALITIGYSPKYVDNYCGKIWGNVGLLAEIEAIDDEIIEKIEITRATQNERLRAAYDIAKKQKNASAMTGAVREMNEMAGLRRDKAPNTEREQQIRKSMSEDDLEIAREVARLLTERKSKYPRERTA